MRRATPSVYLTFENLIAKKTAVVKESHHPKDGPSQQRTSAYSYNALAVSEFIKCEQEIFVHRVYLLISHKTRTVTDASLNGSILVVCTRSRKNQETIEGILE